MGTRTVAAPAELAATVLKPAVHQRAEAARPAQQPAVPTPELAARRTPPPAARLLQQVRQVPELALAGLAVSRKPAVGAAQAPGARAAAARTWNPVLFTPLICLSGPGRLQEERG